MTDGTIPPKNLRFMGESDEQFCAQGDYLVKRVFEYVSDIHTCRVLDIGCGYGRLPYGLRRARFGGTYSGFDVLSRHIEWLQRYFDAGNHGGRYEFAHIDVQNERYNPTGTPLGRTEFPFGHQTYDIATSFSVFTHMYERDIEEYFRRVATMLKDGGIWLATFFRVPVGFALGSQSEDTRYLLRAAITPHAFVHDLADPLFVIAYRYEYLARLFASAGFEIVTERKGYWFSKVDGVEIQDWFILRKCSA